MKDTEIRVIQPQAKGLLEPLKLKEAREDALLKTSRRPNLANLEFWISGSRTVRDYIFVVLSLSVVICYGSHGKLTQ